MTPLRHRGRTPVASGPSLLPRALGPPVREPAAAGAVIAAALGPEAVRRAAADGGPGRARHRP